MKVISIACNHCGAPLDVPIRTKYLTCGFCKSRLQVQKSGNAYSTSVLEAVNEIKDDVETIKLQNRLERIDREWEMDRSDVMLTDKYGRAHVPSTGFTFMYFVVAAFGVFWTCFAGAMFPPMAIFGILFVIGAVVGGIRAQRKHADYQARRSNWERRRRNVLAELRGASSGNRD